MAVELDNPETWPSEIVGRVRGLAVCPESWQDVPLRDWVENEFLDLGVVAYHCTRLTVHEVEDVTRHGLRPLSPDLVSSRVRAAHTAGELSDSLMRAIDASHWAHKPNRVGQIAFLGSRAPFRHRRHTVHYLLGEWGGEAVAFALERTPFQQDLQRIGTPSIVVVTLDQSTVHRVSPDLLTVAWKAMNEPDDVDCEIVVKGSVPSNTVREVVQPGTTKWLAYFGEDWRPLEEPDRR